MYEPNNAHLYSGRGSGCQRLPGAARCLLLLPARTDPSISQEEKLTNNQNAKLVTYMKSTPQNKTQRPNCSVAPRGAFVLLGLLASLALADKSMAAAVSGN